MEKSHLDLKTCSELIYLTPFSSFPLRTWTKITACCGLWLSFGVTLSFSSTTFHCAFPLSISTRHWTLWKKKINNWPLIVWNSDLLSVTKTSIDLMSIWRHLDEMATLKFPLPSKYVRRMNFTWLQSPTFHSGQRPALQLVVGCGLFLLSHFPRPPLHSTVRSFFPFPHETEHCGIMTEVYKSLT